MRFVLYRRSNNLTFYNIATGWVSDPRQATIFIQRPIQLAKDLKALISIFETKDEC